MDKDLLIRRLMETFHGELQEHVRTLNDGLLALEGGGPAADQAGRYRAVFRAAHSLKGAARSVGVGPIEDACHHLEEILGAARDGKATPGREVFGLLFEAADAIEEAGMRLRERADLADSPLESLIPRLADLAGGRTAGVIQAATTPLAPDPGVAGVRPRTPVAAPPSSPPGSEDGPQPPRETESLASASELIPEHASGGFVRLPAEKLDDLLTRSGELMVACRRLETRRADLAAIQDLLGRGRATWAGAAKRMRVTAGDDPPQGAAGPPGRRADGAILRVGEHLGRVERELARLAVALKADERQLQGTAGRLDEQVRRVRMLPFAEACQGLARAARDVAQAEGKAVELVVEGGDVELDRSILEGLKDPLNHLVRNAVSHGVEAPEARLRAGKPSAGRVVVSASLRGAQVEVVVADDGAGLDRDALRRHARSRGLPDLPEGQDPAHLIFLPGFSTAAALTSISGRGVGMDVVKTRLEELHGTIDLASRPGRGLRLTMAVPLTLTTLRALLVSAGGQTFALATTHVQKMVRIGPEDLRSVCGREMLAIGGAPLPVFALAEALGLPGRDAPRPAGARRPGLVIAAGERRLALVVDELLAEQEVVVKGLGPRIPRARNLSGATILPSGRIALLLNASGVIRSALSLPSGRAPMLVPGGAAPAARGRLLVVDDSITTRTLERSILEAAGFEVTTAVDGEDAWDILRERRPDLVISDVQMPRMDGYELTQAIRASPRLSGLPVILLTSLATEQDRARGLEVGADAYVVKGAFDQGDLLETIAQLL